MLDKNDDKDHGKDLSIEIRAAETVPATEDENPRKRIITPAYLEDNSYFFLCLWQCENNTAFRFLHNNFSFNQNFAYERSFTI